MTFFERCHKDSSRGSPGFAALRAALVKCNHNLNIFLFDTFTCGNREFFSLLSCLAFIGVRCSSPFRSAITCIHIIFDCRIMRMNIFQNTVLNRPFEKIELTNRRFYRRLIVIRDLDSFPTAKGVKVFFRIRLQFQFIFMEHFESRGFCGRGFSIDDAGNFIHCEIFLGVIGHKPIYNSQGYLRITINDFHHLLKI